MDDIYTLAVVPPGTNEPSVSIHESWDAAVAWLRSGWDVDGLYDDLDEGTFIDSLRDLDYGVAIDAHTISWSIK
ncbi:hypothetical protein PBI_LUCKY2013_201 [Mycobacterium phage Lucky2013]|uniref:Uncharacterized protein n=1 Tax=Acinetobacter baumannii TaxID=470 RepID=A0AAJ0QSB5_ACIBA|nr:hypothetical protein [Acinetobacter baumannii]ASD50813.1 hypothetical protein PORCELAIN_204 [Mycobacterium phage Porcelain]ASD53592.1 hypothetical protein PBI_LUCKY2013_201 [Mycobacterium phage Lucky2013]ATN89008.1 hypothetical protein SEA_DMPSTRDIVER_203 [Mycobacterium phage DmpstrDiver]QQM15348.1 hypothetical protein SEA_POUND_193 [Mycobacterium phage Pound]KZA06976.1 hypothetical protein LV35_04233 [Acinetobacter baumannii]